MMVFVMKIWLTSFIVIVVVTFARGAKIKVHVLIMGVHQSWAKKVSISAKYRDTFNITKISEVDLSAKYTYNIRIHFHEVQSIHICIQIHLESIPCGIVHKPFAYHAGARRSFPGGDNATPQTAKQTANKGCTIVHLK